MIFIKMNIVLENGYTSTVERYTAYMACVEEIFYAYLMKDIFKLNVCLLTLPLHLYCNQTNKSVIDKVTFIKFCLGVDIDLPRTQKYVPYPDLVYR